MTQIGRWREAASRIVEIRPSCKTNFWKIIVDNRLFFNKQKFREKFIK